MKDYFTDKVPPFRTEWQTDNFVNGVIKPNKNNRERERTTAVMEDPITGRIYVVSTIRHINFPNDGKVAKLVLNNRLKLLRELDDDNTIIMRYGYVFSSREDLLENMKSDIVSAALRGELPEDKIQKILDSFDKRYDKKTGIPQIQSISV